MSADIKRFKELLANVKANVMEMANIYQSAGEERFKFWEACPEIPMSVWDTLLGIADKSIYEGVLWTRHATRKMIRNLPYDVQKEFCEVGLKVLSNDGTHRMVKLRDADEEDINQLINGDKYIRTLAQQKSYLEHKQSKKKDYASYPRPWVIEGKRLIIVRPTTFKASDLYAILDKMEGR